MHARDFRAAEAEIPEHVGPLEAAFYAHTGNTVHKWVHYLPIYDRHFEKFRRSPVRMIEIGVYRGGSLQLWKNYFGPGSSFLGIDIDEKCRAFENENTRIMIGDQSDPKFLGKCLEAIGGEVDIVIDDGSHIGKHICVSFDSLFPYLSEGGLYVIEDLHCNYWRRYGGGFGRAGFIEKAKRHIDDLHHWYHPFPASMNGIGAMHCYDSMIVYEKASPKRPFHIKMGADFQ